MNIPKAGNFKVEVLKAVCNVQRGFSFDNSKYRSSGKAVLKVLNVQEGRIDTTDLVYFSEENYKQDLSKYICKPGEVVITTSGASSGKIAINDTDRNFYISSTVCKFCIDEKRLTNKYLYHYLLSIRKEIKKLVRGTAVKALPVSDIESIKINIPSLESQERITLFLDKLLELKSNLKDKLEKELKLREFQYEYYRDFLIGGGFRLIKSFFDVWKLFFWNRFSLITFNS